MTIKRLLYSRPGGRGRVYIKCRPPSVHAFYDRGTSSIFWPTIVFLTSGAGSFTEELPNINDCAFGTQLNICVLYTLLRCLNYPPITLAGNIINVWAQTWIIKRVQYSRPEPGYVLSAGPRRGMSSIFWPTIVSAGEPPNINHCIK